MTFPKSILPMDTPAGATSRLRIFRVYNGWTGNGAIHRVVVAEDKEHAEALAWRVWGMPGRQDRVKRESVVAEEVNLWDGVEAEDQDL